MHTSRHLLPLMLVTALVSSAFAHSEAYAHRSLALDRGRPSSSQADPSPSTALELGGPASVLSAAPSLTGLLPDSALVGSTAISVTVTGSGFQADAIVQWNGTAVPTTFNSDTEVVGELPAEALQQAGTIQIAVANPIPGGGYDVSLALPFTVNNPVPVLDSVIPQEVSVGGIAFDLYLNGSDFAVDAQALWNGSPLTTTYVTSSLLIAAVPAALIAAEGTISVAARNPIPGGGTSNSLSFTITPPANVWVAHSPEGGVIDPIVVDPNDPLIVYAGTHFGGVVKSVDGGANWVSINRGLDLSGVFFAVAVNPLNSSMVATASQHNTYVSRDGGSTWAKVRSKGAWSLQFDPHNNGVLYATFGPRFYRSLNAGQTWSELTGGRFAASASSQILHAAIDWANPGTWYVVWQEVLVIGGIDQPQPPQLWRTTNAGSSWSQITTIPEPLTYVEVDPAHPAVLYGVAEHHVYRSENGGTSWTQVSSDDTKLYLDVYFTPADPNYVYIGSGSGVFYSANGGQSWQRMEAGLQIMNLAIDPSNPLVLYGGGQDGMYKSTNLGTTWSPINRGLSAHLITGLAYSSSSNALFGYAFSDGFWKSTDYGVTWNHMDIPVQAGVGSFISDPNDPDHMFNLCCLGWPDKILETTDAWGTWASRSIPYGVMIFAANSHLYAGSGTEPRIYESTDNGNTWTEKSNGLPVCQATCRVVLLAADPAAPDVIYGILRSSYLLTAENYFVNIDYIVKTIDGGDTWTRIDSGLITTNHEYTALTIDPANPSILYLAAARGVSRSMDGGATWTETGTLPWTELNVLVVDPGNDQIVYVGTEGYGVYRSSNRGDTWASFNYGMTPGRVRAMLPIPAAVPPGPLSQVQAASSTRLSRLYSVMGGQVYSYFVVNYAPTDLNLPQSTIPGRMPVGTTVGSFVTSDPNPDDAFSYTMVSGEGDTDNASFTISGSQLQTAEVFDQALKTNYSIRVRSTDSGGLYVEKAFTILVTANSRAPLLASPANGQPLIYNRPLFDWEDVDGAASYKIQVARDRKFGNLVLSKTVAPSEYLPTTSLPPHATLYWRVRGVFSGVAGPWSVVRTVVTANPPGGARLLAPANGSLVTDYTPRLDWSTVSVPGGTSFSRYQVQVSASQLFDPAAIVVDHDVLDLASSEYELETPLESNTTYYWRVRSFNTLGHYTAWSAVSSFRAALLPPVLSSPADDSITPIATRRPTFTWNDPNVGGVTSYTIQVSKNSSFTAIVMSGSSATTSFTPGADLPAGRVLFWRVRIRGANGPSLWSPFWSFLTN